jgi:Fur family transcriptional regulator, peroxide stress response regulator
MRIIPENQGAVAPAKAAAALRARGLRLTGPRRVVLEVVRGTDTHPTAEWIHGMVRRRLPQVSLGTVYRNLRRLVDAGLVNELPGPHARFDANVSEHHHFTCTACGRIVDVAGTVVRPQARALAARIGAATGLGITHQRIEFYGRCLRCRARTGRRRDGASPGRRTRRPS